VALTELAPIETAVLSHWKNWVCLCIWGQILSTMSTAEKTWGTFVTIADSEQQAEWHDYSNSSFSQLLCKRA